MRRLRGFTIVELLVVILIIGVLLAAAASNFANARKSGRDSRRIADVLLIANAVDQSAALNRGVYPKSVTDRTRETFCANELMTDPTGASNPNGIDLSIFRNRAIPKDPLPEISAATCSDYKNGYTYSRFMTGGTGLATTNPQGETFQYVLQVGLETEKNSDEGSLLLGTLKTNRTQYLYKGKACQFGCQQ